MEPARTGLTWNVGAAIFAAASIVALATAGAACGPSYQSIYEGDARFEHCYALDDASDVPLVKKRDCWDEWRVKSTLGQSRNRVDYANARAAALKRAEVAPTDDSLMQAAPGGGTTNQVLAPESYNAFAPPPKTLEAMDGGASSAVAQGPEQMATTTPLSPVSPTASRNGAANANAGGDAGVMTLPADSPGAACTTSCSQKRQNCQAISAANGTTNSCDPNFKKCMQQCFK